MQWQSHGGSGARTSSSPSPVDVGDADLPSSPEWQEESHSEILSRALKALASTVPDQARDKQSVEGTAGFPIPHVVEPADEDHIGKIALPSELEIRPASSGPRHPMLIYWGLAFGALSDKVYEGVKLLRDAIGPERPVPKGHVRVRWTCVSVGVLESQLVLLISYSRVESHFMMISLNSDRTQPVSWKHT